MGCCFSEPVDFDGEVTLFHFDLLRAIGRGAFGKVSALPSSCFHISHLLAGSSRGAQTLKKVICTEIH